MPNELAKPKGIS